MIGTVIKNKYLIKELIAEGGMAFVYKAYCKDTDRDVAVKVLKPEYYLNAQYVNSFKKEVESVLRLNHENIVSAVDVGISDGKMYFVMDYIPGDNLRSIMRRTPVMDIEKAVSIAEQLCFALGYAHNAGVIHKDVKPENIILTPDGKPMLMDFGIANNDFDVDSTSEEDESPYEVLGSVNYFSPEQARGLKVDKRTDIYSVGIMLYEMVTGQLPFIGDDALSVALKHIHQTAVKPSDINPKIPNSLNKIILKAISKDKTQRYRSAYDMMRDLKRCINEADGDYIKYTIIEDNVNIKNRRFKPAHIISIISAIIAAAAVIMVFIGVFTGKNNILVPAVVGSDEKSAYDSLDKLGFVVNVERGDSDEYEPGIVISVSPDSGSALEKGSEVTITVSQGDTRNKMPDLTGKNIPDAIELLKKLKYANIAIINDYSSKKEPGTVLAQDPLSNSVLIDTQTITLTISGHNALAEDANKITVPDITGSDIKAACDSANSVGYRKLLIYLENREYDDQTVFMQSPTSGSVDTNDFLLAWVACEKDANYSASYNFTVSDFEAGMNIRITLPDSVCDKTETVLYETLIEDSNAFFNSLNGVINMNVWIDSEESKLPMNVYLYKNGMLSGIKTIVFLRIDNEQN